MSRYTTEVRFICEEAAGLEESVGFDHIDEVLTSTTINKICNFQFPIFDENYRDVLLKKILEHYYTREIGLETVGLWKLKFRAKMNEIMPFYNKLYESELIEFNPMYDVELSKSHFGNDNVDTNSKSSGDSSNVGTGKVKSKFSDTPQGGLSGLEADTYLTNANIDESNNFNANHNDNTSNSNINSTDSYIEYVVGKNGLISYSKKLIEFRKTFLNIDMDVIEDLSDLFMKLW